MDSRFVQFKNLLTTSFGLDPLIIISVAAKIFQAIGLLLLLTCVGFFLNEVERGFYFSFTSLAALQIFFELGIGTVIVQHSARFIVDCGGNLHNENLDYSSKSFKDMKGLFNFNLLWTLLSGSLLFLIVFPVSIVFFNNIPESSSVSWFHEWLILCISVSLFLPFSAQLSFFEGAGYLYKVLKLRLALSIISYLLAILLLSQGFGLYAVSMIFITPVILISLWIYYEQIKIYKIMMSLFNIKGNFIYWFKRLLPMQWRIAVSWICGFIAFQSATPVTLKYFGAIAAGELGFLLNITNAIVGFMGAWVTTKIPIFSKYIEDQEYSSLDNLFFFTARKSAIVFLTLSVLIFYSSQVYFSYNETYFITNMSIVSFLLIASLTTISYAQAVYLRSFLQELFVVPSLTYALLIVILLPVLINYYGFNGLLAAYALAAIISTCLTTQTFVNFKKNIRI